MLEDRRGAPVRFTLLTQRGHTVWETAAAVLAEDLRQVGIAVDVVPLEFGALIQRVTAMDFDAAYLGFRASDTDPASNLDLWLSSAAFHFWNPSQPSPSTAWEGHIDDMMAAQIAAPPTLNASGSSTRFSRSSPSSFRQSISLLPACSSPHHRV